MALKSPELNKAFDAYQKTPDALKDKEERVSTFAGMLDISYELARALVENNFRLVEIINPPVREVIKKANEEGRRLTKKEITEIKGSTVEASRFKNPNLSADSYYNNEKKAA